MKNTRRAKLLEQLIMNDFDRMMEVKTRGERRAAFATMADHIKQRSPEQVKRMEREQGIRLDRSH